MKSVGKIILFLGIGGIFAWHFLVIGLTIAPINPITRSLSPFMDVYLNYTPFFPQSWKFFAPQPPQSDNFLYYRCHRQDDDSWDQWKNPGEELLRRHHSNRATYRGKLVYIYLEMARSINNQAIEIVSDLQCSPTVPSCKKNYEEEIMKTKEYKLASRFTTDLCRFQYNGSGKNGGVTIDKVEFRTVEIMVPPFSPPLPSKNEEEGQEVTIKGNTYIDYPLAQVIP